MLFLNCMVKGDKGVNEMSSTEGLLFLTNGPKLGMLLKDGLLTQQIQGFRFSS